MKNIELHYAMGNLLPTRYGWATKDPLLLEYHDREWGVQVHNDRKHFEFLILEGAQAGLNWLTILKKRQNYRKAFNSFNPGKVAKYSRGDLKRRGFKFVGSKNLLRLHAGRWNCKRSYGRLL
jgi:3-methyladenine DNA glycosylase Tag